jgi:2-oxoisovalerate ferredoxin oxidoreductase gamma subunit
LFEIRIHGRGGQGAVTAAEILAEAVFREGMWTQKIPVYGVERRGSPVEAFVRIDEKPITILSYVYEPDCIIVLDPMLPKVIDVTRGLKESGIAILNSLDHPKNIDLNLHLSKVATVDASKIFIDLLGPRAITFTNTTMLGAFSKATSLVKLESLLASIKETFSGEIGEINLRMCKKGYEKTRTMEFEGERG